MPKKTLQEEIDNLFFDLNLPSDKEIQYETATIKRSQANTIHKKGKKDSLETRTKKSIAKTGLKKPYHSKKLKGRKRPEFAKTMLGKQVGEKNGKSNTYIITEPSGKTYEIAGLKGFAKKLNKPFITAYEMATGKYPGNTSKRGAWANWIIKEKTQIT